MLIGTLPSAPIIPHNHSQCPLSYQADNQLRQPLE